jgi:hypothetical protein
MFRFAWLHSALSGLLGLVLALMASACGGRLADVPTFPLYPNPGQQLPPSQLAKLFGISDAAMSGPIIKAVDNRDVLDKDPSAFALLPGCHVVATSNNLIMGNENVTWRGTLPTALFAFNMKAGHTYVVRLSIRQDMSSGGQVIFRGEEQDATGKRTADFDPVRSLDEIQACLSKKHGE